MRVVFVLCSCSCSCRVRIVFASWSLQALKDTFLDVDRFIGTKLGSDCKYVDLWCCFPPPA